MSDCHTRRVAPAVAAAFTLIKFPQSVGPILWPSSLSAPVSLSLSFSLSLSLPFSPSPSLPRRPSALGPLTPPFIRSSRATVGSSINHCTLRLTSRTSSHVGGSSRERLFEIARARAPIHIHIHTPCVISFFSFSLTFDPRVWDNRAVGPTIPMPSAGALVSERVSAPACDVCRSKAMISR